ncbi:reticulocyte binding protein 2b (RBP2b) [Plasmodium ovale curtisi]|uniref:Reticulocyte binding protein 2b (RBP2b) n=1 Tax=Plasmodium ovale curtisi TaxID=864141 RepID=A0A1A8XA51_PLAOA|nr:reticulocyte binding protein 2b (RBP2b) [Plasmodium ovale curtisi]
MFIKVNNRSKSKKLKKELKLLPLHYNLRENNKSKYISGEEENIKNDNYPNEQEHNINSNNKINFYEGTKSYLRSNTPFTTLKKEKATNKLSYNDYKKRDILYTNYVVNNNRANTHEQIYFVENSFIQKGTQSKVRPKPKSMGNSKPVSQKGVAKKPNVTDTLEYIEGEDHNKNKIYQLRPHYVYIHYFNEIKHFTTYHHEIKQEYSDEFEPLVKTLSDDMAKAIKNCEQKKHNLKNLINILENPEQHRLSLETYDEEHRKYETHMDAYKNCLKDNNNNTWRELIKIKAGILKMLTKLKCNTFRCPTNVYVTIIKTYMIKIKDFPYEKNATFIKKYTDSFKMGVFLIKKIEGLLGEDIKINTTKFIQEEMKYIIDNFNNHLEKLVSAFDYIKDLFDRRIQTEVTKRTLSDNYDKIAYYYALHLLIKDFLPILESALNIKERILHTSFSKIEGDLQKKIIATMDSEYYLKKSTDIISDCENILKSGQNTYEKKSPIMENPELYSNSEIVEAKKKYHEKKTQLEEVLNKLKLLIKHIKESYELNLLEKSDVERRKNNISSRINAQEKAKELVDIIEAIGYNKQKAYNNYMKIEESYKQAKLLQIEIEELTKSIKEYEKNIENLIKDEKESSSLKKDIKNKMDYITKGIAYIKEVIFLNEEIEKKIQIIEKLINEFPYKKNEFTNEKTDLYNSVESIINKIHNGNLKRVVEQMSTLVETHNDFINKSYTKEQIIEILNKTKEECNKLKTMKYEESSQILDELRTQLSDILKLKDKIIREQFNYARNDMASTIDELKNKYTHLTNSLSAYKMEELKLEEYKNDMTLRIGKFLDAFHENDNDVSEGKNIYNEFLNHKDAIMNTKSMVSNEINILKENINNFENLWTTYSDKMQKLQMHSEEKYKENTTLFQDFKSKITDLKMNEYEEEFNKYNQISSNAIGEIERLNTNIGIIKTLNIALNHSANNKKLIDELIENKKGLIEKIYKHMQAIKNESVIQQNEDINFEQIIEDKIANIHSHLGDSTIDNLKTDINKIFSYCKSLKENIKNDNGIPLENLDEKNIKCDNIKREIDKLKANYEVQNTQIDDLIKGQKTEIIKLIDKIIKKKGENIINEADKHMDSLENMKTILSSLNIDQEIDNDSKVVIQGKISAMQKKVEALVQKINENNDKLKKIKEKSYEYMKKSDIAKGKHIESSAKEDEQTAFNIKKENMEKILEQMKAAFNDLNGLEKEETTRNEVDSAEIEYERILIDNFLQQIKNQHEKTKMVMKDIEASIEKIEDTKRNIFDQEQRVIKGFEYEENYTKAKDNNDKIRSIVTNSIERNEKANSSIEKNTVKKIKQEVKNYIPEIIKAMNIMENALSDIKNVHKLLVSNNSKIVIGDILRNTQRAEEFKNQTIKEFDKIKNIIEIVKMKLEDAKEHKKQINIHLDDDEIDEKIDKIKKIEKEIATNKAEINTCLGKAEACKQNYLSEFHNANRGKSKIDFLQKNSENGENHLNADNMNNVTESIAKFKKYSNEVETSENKAKQNKQLFSQHEKYIAVVLNESLTLGIETKSEKKKNMATKMLGEIEQEHSKIQESLQTFQKKLDELNEIPDTSDTENNFNNAESTKANVDIQHNIERVKTNLSYIQNVKEEVAKILISAKDSMRSISRFSGIDNENELEHAKRKERIYAENLGNIKDHKKLMVEEQNKLKLINSNIEDIEQKLKEHKKLYEVGILQMIREIARKRKSYMDNTEKLLTSSADTFNSLFNGFDLKEYNIRKNFENYKKELKEINSQFDKSYNSIENKAKKVLDNSVDYVTAKELRKAAIVEEEFLKTIEEEAKNFLSDAKKMESFRLIYHLKENLVQRNNICKKQYLQVEKAHNDIKELIEEIKELEDESASFVQLEKAVDRNRQVQTTIHHSHKNEAQNILNHLVNSANFVDIKIEKGFHLSDLKTYANIQTAQLNFESKIEAELKSTKITGNTNELKVYENMQTTYQNFLQILKYTDGIDEKQRENENLIKAGNQICLNIRSINELKNKLKTTKSKKNDIASKIDSTFKKINDIEKIMCNYNNYYGILDKSKGEELEGRINSYNQEKRTTLNESQLQEKREDFYNDTKSLYNFEKEVEKLKAGGSSKESIQKEQISVDGIYKKIEGMENEITRTNSSLDKLLKKGKECENFIYTLIKGNLNNKMNDDLIIIYREQKKSQEYMEYVKKNYNNMYKQINTLNDYFATKTVNDYTLTNLQEATKYSSDLIVAINEFKALINKITKEFIDVNENTEHSTLENNIETLKNLYSNLNDKKNSINAIFKKMHLVKLRDLKASSEKYITVAQLFNKVEEAQRKRLLENQRNLENVKTIITNKEKELRTADSTFTMESINKFHEIYDHIKTNVEELKNFEEINDKEDKKIQIYKEQIYHLIKRRDALLDDINEYDKNDKTINENEDITRQINSDVRIIKDALNNSEQKFKKLLENFKENEKLYKNNNSENFLSEILKKIDNLKGNFTKHIPLREKLYQIESNLNGIKDIFNDIHADFNIDTFVNRMSMKIQNEKGILTVLRNGEKVLENMLENIIEKTQIITNDNGETKYKLSQINNAFERIKIKKKDIDHLFSTISPSDNNNAYTSAKKKVDEAYKIVVKIQNYIDNITHVINQAEQAIDELEGHHRKLLQELEKWERTQKELEERKRIQKELGEQGKEINKVISSNPNIHEYDLLRASQEHTHDTEGDSEQKQNKNNQNLDAIFTDSRIRLAGGIIIGFSICFVLVFVIVTYGKENKNEEEKDVKEHDEEFEGSDNLDLQDKEEVIEVLFNEDDELHHT